MMLEGKIIDNKYKIIEQVGEGGMSYVYLARDTRLNKQWAVKRIKFGKKNNRKVVIKSFLKEANLLKNLDHPLLPRIVDIVEEDNDIIYVVMDYIEGIALNDVIELYGQQSQDVIVGWGIQICDALAYLHSRQNPIVFRDLKPSNIMLTPEGTIKLIDFGSAIEYSTEEYNEEYLGTPGYAAPEQYKGSGLKVDTRSDIYTFGKTLYYLFTEDKPKKDIDINIREVKSEVSEGIEKIVNRCIERNPQNRYQTIEEVEYDLQHYKEFENKYRKKQLKKILIFSINIALSIIFFVSSLFGAIGMKKKKNSDYNILLSEASNYVSSSIANDSFSENAVNTYESAIDLDPQKSEACIKMLDYYIRMEQTQIGLDKVETYIQRKNGMEKNSDVLLAVASLYFNGTSKDTEFNVDYSKASKYYAMINEKEVTYAKYYKELSIALSQFSSSIDWEDICQRLDEFEQYIDSQNKNATQIENYLSLVKVYITNKSYINDIGKDSYEIIINNLQKAKETMEFLNEKSITEKYESEIYIDLAETFHLRGISKNSTEDYEKALNYYELAAESIDINSTKINLLSKEADIYRSIKDYNNASQKYEYLISNYPDSIDAYAAYGMMEITELRNVEKAKDLYEKAQKISGADKNSNLKALFQKLKNAGRI